MNKKTNKKMNNVNFILTVILAVSLQTLTGCSRVDAVNSQCRINVKDTSPCDAFLAAPLPSEDASPLIQAALEERGVVRLRDGDKFYLHSPIRLSSGQGLIGAAVLVPAFEPDIQFDGMIEMQSSGLNSAIIIQGKDIFLDGIKIRKSFVDGSYGVGVTVLHSENVSLRNLEITRYSARYGISIIESTSIEVTGCIISDFMMDTVADTISDSPAGISLKRCKNGVISNNRVLRIENGPTGRAARSPFIPEYGPSQGYQSDNIFVGQSDGIAITGNVLETSGEGIDLLLSSNCTVTGNIIRDIWFQGIKMLGVSSTTVSGNLISDCYQGIGLASHLTRDAECANNVITGNVILNTGTPGSFEVRAPNRVNYSVPAGIDINDTSQNNIITNNVIRNIAADAEMTVAIRTNHEFNLIENNLVDHLK